MKKIISVFLTPLQITRFIPLVFLFIGFFLISCTDNSLESDRRRQAEKDLVNYCKDILDMSEKEKQDFLSSEEGELFKEKYGELGYEYDERDIENFCEDKTSKSDSYRSSSSRRSSGSSGRSRSSSRSISGSSSSSSSANIQSQPTYTASRVKGAPPITARSNLRSSNAQNFDYTTPLDFDYSGITTTYRLGESINICLLHRVIPALNNRYMVLYIWEETIPSWVDTTVQLEPVFDLCLTGTPNNSADVGEHTISGVINRYNRYAVPGSFIFKLRDWIDWSITLTVTGERAASTSSTSASPVNPARPGSSSNNNNNQNLCERLKAAILSGDHKTAAALAAILHRIEGQASVDRCKASLRQ